jgi:hypothetical protein
MRYLTRRNVSRGVLGGEDTFGQRLVTVWRLMGKRVADAYPRAAILISALASLSMSADEL